MSRMTISKLQDLAGELDLDLRCKEEIQGCWKVTGATENGAIKIDGFACDASRDNQLRCNIEIRKPMPDVDPYFDPYVRIEVLDDTEQVEAGLFGYPSKMNLQQLDYSKRLLALAKWVAQTIDRELEREEA